MIRAIAFILGVKLLLLAGSYYFNTPPAEHADAFEVNLPTVEIMTESEYQAYLEREEVKRQKEEGTYWTEERIEEAIRATFPETPNTAVAIAKCESGLNPTQQSYHQLSYGREQSFGIFQIHAPDHNATALRLGLPNYRTDVEENLKMARYIYDDRGNWTAWTCYTKGLYKAHL